MLAAFIVALMNASVMLVGFIFYILGILGSAGKEILSAASSVTTTASEATASMPDASTLAQAMDQLGMSSTSFYRICKRILMLCK